MKDELYDIKVTDRQDFIKFLHLLREDFLNNKSDWENSDMASFLEALSAYAKDLQGYYNNSERKIDADMPSWQAFADILLGAKIYE
jgi:hypothetical protein